MTYNVDCQTVDIRQGHHGKETLNRSRAPNKASGSAAAALPAVRLRRCWTGTTPGTRRRTRTPGHPRRCAARPPRRGLPGLASGLRGDVKSDSSAAKRSEDLPCTCRSWSSFRPVPVSAALVLLPPPQRGLQVPRRARGPARAHGDGGPRARGDRGARAHAQPARPPMRSDRVQAGEPRCTARRGPRKLQ